MALRIGGVLCLTMSIDMKDTIIPNACRPTAQQITFGGGCPVIEAGYYSLSAKSISEFGLDNENLKNAT
jgi:hypothetical protein